jgi:hypothetical protein
MLTPGAAMSTTGPKLLKQAKMSSPLTVQAEKATVCGLRLPGCPSKSAMAETAMASAQLAGLVFWALVALFPAATA